MLNHSVPIFFFQSSLFVSERSWALIFLQISSYQQQPLHDTKIWKILISHIHYHLLQASFEKQGKQYKIAKTQFIDLTMLYCNIKVPLHFYIILNYSYKIVEWIVP